MPSRPAQGGEQGKEGEKEKRQVAERRRCQRRDVAKAGYAAGVGDETDTGGVSKAGAFT